VAPRLQPYQGSEGLQDLQVRVVRLSELGGAKVRAAIDVVLETDPTPRPAAPPQRARPSPQAPSPTPARKVRLSSVATFTLIVCALLLLAFVRHMSGQD